jgi:hypothetical protein
VVVEDAPATRSASEAQPGGGRHWKVRPDRSWSVFARLDGRPSATVFIFLLLQTIALLTQVLAVYMARYGANAPAQVVSSCAFGLTFASALWALTRPQLARSVRNAAVVCLGVTTALQWYLRDPLLFRGYDEQQHARTLHDIVSSHGLFQENPLLDVSPRYPGFEALAALFHQLGLPVMAASITVVLVARLALVLVLCDAVEQLTGSSRAGGLAVAVYACSAHFASWDAQFAYQTLALPLALAAVAFVARARRADDPRILLIGASVCLLAVAFTHHVTSVLTATFLAVWAVVERGQPRRRVLFGAMVAVVVSAAWSAIQWPLLWKYFGPVFTELAHQASGGLLRVPFSNRAMQPVPLWEQLLIYYYAAAVALIVLAVTLVYARAILRRRRPGAPHDSPRWWQPRTLLVLIAALMPVLVLTRVLPGFIEISDRLNTFLFLPLSLLVADCVVRWSRSQPGPLNRRLRALTLVLATGVFVGGYLLGSGGYFGRLPGGYLPGGESRSIDSETIAAVRWAGDALPSGSRVAADRMSAAVLSSEAGLWPVLAQDKQAITWLYSADYWGSDQHKIVRDLRLRYLYVDRRLADGLPLVGVYFFVGESELPQLLTLDELTKFDDVPGVQVVYRHGPVTIYDLSGLGYGEVRSGWFGESRQISIPVQLALGLLIGLILAIAVRFGAGVFAIEKARAFRIAAGPSLTFAAGLSALCVMSIALLSARVWLDPLVFASAALVVLLVNPKWANWARDRLRRGAAVSWKWVAASSMVALLVVTTIALAILDASADDVTSVRTILDDPSAIHLSHPRASE